MTQANEVPDGIKMHDPMIGVPIYSELDAETKAFVDDLIAMVDASDVTTVLDFAKEPIQKLGATTDEVIRNAGPDNPILESFQTLNEDLGSIDIGGLGEKAMNMGAKGIGWVVKNPGTAVATIAAGTFLSPLALIGVPFAKSQINKIQAKRDGTDVADALRKSITKSGEIIENLEEAGKTIPDAIRVLNQLGLARETCYREVGLYICATIERLRILDEEEIPALQAILAGGSAYEAQEAEAQLQNYYMSSQQLASKRNDLVGSRLASQIAMVTLTRLKNVFTLAAGKVNSHLSTSVPQWKAQMLESGVALTAYKLTEAVNEADNFGMTVMQQGAKVADKTARMMIESSRKGTYDPEKIAAVLTSMAKGLGEDIKMIASRRDDTDADYKKLASAQQQFRLSLARVAEEGQSQLALAAGAQARGMAALEHKPEGMG